jgi:hypothetical protein
MMDAVLARKAAQAAQELKKMDYCCVPENCPARHDRAGKMWRKGGGEWIDCLCEGQRRLWSLEEGPGTLVAFVAEPPGATPLARPTSPGIFRSVYGRAVLPATATDLIFESRGDT